VSLWSELRRRKVVRVGVAYLVVALAVGEGADIFFPQLGAPAWVVPVILGLLVLGFPLSLVLAWAYDITPEGMVKDSAAHGAPIAASGATPTEGSHPPRVSKESAPSSSRAADGRPSVAVLLQRMWPEHSPFEVDEAS
jgi:hypothetical protein